MTFFFRYLLGKRKFRNFIRAFSGKRRKLEEATESQSPCQQRFQFQAEENKEEERETAADHADELLLGLPDSILADILSRLSFKDVCICRCVCKAWRSLIYSPDFNSLRLERAEPEVFLRSDAAIYNSRALHLVDLHEISAPVSPPYRARGRAMNVRLSVSLPERNRVDTDILMKTRNAASGAKRFYDIVNSCNGFICLRKTAIFSGQKDPCMVCNPYTGEFTFIPKPEKKGSKKIGPVVSGFGCSLRNKVYKVVRLVYGASALDSIGIAIDRTTEVYSLGSASWRTVGKAPCDEKFHVVDLPSHFLEKLSELDQHKVSLGVLRSCLCASEVTYMGRFDVWVMRNYREHESWTKEFSFSIFFGFVCRPLKWLGNGHLVMLSDRNTIVVCNPTARMFRKFKIQGTKPVVLEAFVHIPSFGSLKDVTGGNNLVVHNAMRWNEPERQEDAETISLMEEENQGMDWAFNIW